MTRIVATADLHGHLPEIPPCDLLLVGGDVCPVHDHNRQFQAEWLRSEFAEWLTESPCDEVVWIGGNHDFVLQDMKREKIDQIPGFYLNGEAREVCGLKIWGSPLSPTFGRWAFMRDDAGLAQEWQKIPRDTDILMIHGPMLGYGDGVPYHSLVKDDKGMHWEQTLELVGSRTLRNRLDHVDYPNMRLFVWGHIHPAYGTYDMPNNCTGINAAHWNDSFTEQNAVYVLDYEKNQKVKIIQPSS